MSNELSLRTYPLSELCAKEDLIFVQDKVFDLLNKGDLTKIKKAFYANSRVVENGMIYIRVKGLANILRNKVARIFVYEGVEKIISPAEVISIDGEEYISGPELAKLLEYRLNSTTGKTRMYIAFAREVYDFINDLKVVDQMRAIYWNNIEDVRKDMKVQRIKKYNISFCEFTGIKFHNNSEVQFAHINSVITKPHLALDLDNGVIIFQDIHAELTRLEIHDFEGMYNYCIERGYNTNWAN